MRTSSCFPLVGILALCAVPAVSAQTGPVIHGVTGTFATEGTIKEEYKGAHKIVVVTEDGVEHAYDAAKDMLVHGGTKALTDLKPGSTVVIHYTSDAAGQSAHEIDTVGADGLSTTEGMITKIDRGKKEITIRYDNGTTEKLILTDRAAVDAGNDFTNAPTGTTRIIVYYSNETGRKMAHYFRRKS